MGDIHGNLKALLGLLAALDERKISRTIFLGDYVNKGPSPADVLEVLLVRRQSGRATLLAGNHEAALLSALDTGNVAPFLKMGGATTIRSYLRRQARPDVLSDFRSQLPHHHLSALREMPTVWESGEVVAQHVPPGIHASRFQISAHVPVGKLPRITTNSAQLDTGSGSSEQAGRLTAFMWPSRDYIQVDASGKMIS
ncbi:metallophosphoesterase [Leucobacter sp. Psy1]|uniref:metallophosphoesterase n=1 Tax=Leucobacter sp. Psy1 TaxID=2875729 RepID=UPI001CD52401